MAYCWWMLLAGFPWLKILFGPSFGVIPGSGMLFYSFARLVYVLIFAAGACAGKNLHFCAALSFGSSRFSAFASVGQLAHFRIGLTRPYLALLPMAGTGPQWRSPIQQRFALLSQLLQLVRDLRAVSKGYKFVVVDPKSRRDLAPSIKSAYSKSLAALSAKLKQSGRSVTYAHQSDNAVIENSSDRSLDRA